MERSTEERGEMTALERAAVRPAPVKVTDKSTPVSAKDRQAMMLTGALVLPDGTRVSLRHIETYGPGGDKGVTITMRSGALVHWSAPATGAARGEAPASPKLTAATILTWLDGIFAAG